MSHDTNHPAQHRHSSHEPANASKALADVSASFGAAVQSTREGLGDVGEKVGRAVNQVGKSARETLVEGLDQTKELKKGLDRTVANRPMTALAVALGVGFVAGLCCAAARASQIQMLDPSE